MTQIRRPVRRALAAASAAALLALSACSSSEPSATADAGSSSDESGIAQAKADVAGGADALTQWPKVAPIQNLPDMTGKKVWYVPIGDSVPIIHAIGVGLTQAMEAMGASVTVCDGKFTPTVISDCLAKALNQGADAVVTSFVDYTMVPAAIDELVKNKVPVLVSGVPASGGKQNTENFAFYDPSVRVSGAYQLMSKIALAERGADTDVLWLRLLDSTLTENASDDGIAAYKKLCPGCGIKTIDFTTANIDKLPSAVSAALVANPGINAMIVPNDSFAPNALQGLQASASGKDILVLSCFGDLAGLQRVKSGQQFVDVGTAVVYEGWTVANALLQLLAGADVENEKDFVYRTFTQDNVGDLDLTDSAYLSTDWYGDDSYRDNYLAAWGVS